MNGYIAFDPEQPPIAFQLSFITAEVSAIYEAALSAGATSMAAPSQQPWEQIAARVRDPNGILVSIVTPLPPPGIAE